jgi:putative ABC transport system substrate-binding protein
MNKKILIGLIVVVVLAAVIPIAYFTLKSPTKVQKVYRVGILSGTDAFLPMADGFKSKMAELGYVEGKNITYEIARTNADPAGETAAAKKFIKDKVDLIFTFPTEPTVSAKAAVQGTNIPIVFAYAGVEGFPLVKSVNAPGNNLTGVRFPGPEQMGKRLELIHEIASKAGRIFIIYDKNYPNTGPALATLRPLAGDFGLELVEVPVTTLAEFIAELEKRTQAADAGADAMILMPDILNHSPDGMAAIFKFTSKFNLPLGGSFPPTVEGGAIFGNANDSLQVGSLAAPLADKIFQGIPAGTIPIVTPEQNLWLNYKRAQELGLTIPEVLLNQADNIIR